MEIEKSPLRSSIRNIVSPIQPVKRRFAFYKFRAMKSNQCLSPNNPDTINFRHFQTPLKLKSDSLFFVGNFNYVVHCHVNQLKR